MTSVPLRAVLVPIQEHGGRPRQLRVLCLLVTSTILTSDESRFAISIARVEPTSSLSGQSLSLAT